MQTDCWLKQKNKNYNNSIIVSVMGKYKKAVGYYWAFYFFRATFLRYKLFEMVLNQDRIKNVIYKTDL